jgi:hypothetical protein
LNLAQNRLYRFTIRLIGVIKQNGQVLGQSQSKKARIKALSVVKGNRLLIGSKKLFFYPFVGYHSVLQKFQE